MQHNFPTCTSCQATFGSGLFCPITAICWFLPAVQQGSWSSTKKEVAAENCREIFQESRGKSSCFLDFRQCKHFFRKSVENQKWKVKKKWKSGVFSWKSGVFFRTLVKTRIETLCAPFSWQSRCVFAIASHVLRTALQRCKTQLLAQASMCFGWASCFPSHDLEGLLSFTLAHFFEFCEPQNMELWQQRKFAFGH